MNSRFAQRLAWLALMVPPVLPGGPLYAVPSPAAAAETPALAPPMPELPPTFFEQHQTLVVSGVLLLVALAALGAWGVSRPPPARVLPPEKSARAALARWRSQPETGQLLSEVSQILRRYVGALFDFPGGEMTTAEFCAAIAQNEKIGAELSGALAGLLRECDVRKFSPANSAPPVNAVDRAGEIVTQIEIETRRRHAGTPTQ